MTRVELTALVEGLAPLLREFSAAVGARLALLDATAHGLDGKDGAIGPPGPPGRDGRDGMPGVMGIPGTDGVDGRHGVDGLSVDDFDFDFDPETRGLTVTLSRDGAVVKTLTKTLRGLTIYKGVYQAGQTYTKGDQVTWAGGQWTALTETTAKPGETVTASRAWLLSVKPGRDGKEGKTGPEGPQGPRGRDGIDGRRV